jgi:hypothetical protein
MKAANPNNGPQKYGYQHFMTFEPSAWNQSPKGGASNLEPIALGNIQLAVI